VLVITALKEQLKGKAVLPKAVSLNPIGPALLQVDAVLLIPKLRKNRTAHIDYIKHTLDEAATLRKLVKSERLLSPLNTPLAYACKYTRRIQELLLILQQTRVDLVSSASGSQSKDNPKKNRIQRTLKKAKETELEDHHRNVKSSLNKVVQIVLWYLDSGCSKHKIGDRSQLVNFVHKFLGMVKFRNDHVAKITGYGDYQIGNVTIS
nr:integrase, catalytic region, zinc finger, CCHC-type, peptidase aspartic, catalytic [Tanacetum cinerariifolium]